MSQYDNFDLKILNELQQDGTLTADALSERVTLSRNACWRRMRRLEEDGFIKKRVGIIDAEKVGLALSVVILIRTHQHEPDWLDKFRKAIELMPEIVGAYRLSGDLDYMLRARVSDVKAYDALYQKLIAKVPIADVSASFVMDEIKETTQLPLVPLMSSAI